MSVPTGAFVARRNGKVFVTGNSGFPKSLDVSKAIDAKAGAKRNKVATNETQCTKSNPDSAGVITAPSTPLAQQWAGYGTALKPAWEPAILARKPLEGTVTANVERWGVGGLAIDACRIGTDGGTAKGTFPKGDSVSTWGNGINGACEIVDIGKGRWPANVIMDEEAGAALDAQAGVLKSPKSYKRNVVGHASPNPMERDGGRKDTRDAVESYGDSGGASRFFKEIECDSASYARSLSTSLENPLSAFAQSVAATLESPEATARNPSSSKELFTLVTQLGSALRDARSIESIQSIGERFLLASRLTGTLLTDLARSAAPSELTVITRITTALETCTSCVASAISDCTPSNSGPGVKASDRFMYSAKVSTKEREFGCDTVERIEMRFTMPGSEVRTVQLLVDTASSPPRAISASGMCSSSESEWSTFLFGSQSTAPFRPACRFTTRTGTSSTTESKTWKHSPLLSTSGSTLAATSETEIGGSPVPSAASSSPSTESIGTSPKDTPPSHGASHATLRELFERSESVEIAISEALPKRGAAEMTSSEEGQARLDSPRTGAGRGGGARCHHPTLKPIALTRWLARLIMPPTPNAQLIVPFSGAGSEMIGALQAGWPSVFGIEGEAEYVDIAHARIAAWKKGSP